MLKLICHIPAKMAALFFIVTILALSGCTALKGEGFAIYLSKGDVPPDQMSALNQIDIAEQPLVSLSDIITYNASIHEITLTTGANERISQLEVPVRGKSFIVCLDREPIYWGAFWTPISSVSFEGVTIWKPLSFQDSKVIKLELGYPSSSFFRSEDPRNNARIMKSLQQAGKLVSLPSVTAEDKLPRSMKGYELYAWLQDNQWHFTLITGTNRNKTLEEIVSSEDVIPEDGWVQIHVVGVDAIKATLSRLPQNEPVFWMPGLWPEPTPQGNINIALPTGPILDTIKEHAERSGLDLSVPSAPSR